MTDESYRARIGAIAAHWSGAYHGHVLMGMRQAARRHGLQILAIQTTSEAYHNSQVATEYIDGWVIVNEYSQIETFAASGKPVLTISSTAPNIPAVVANNYGGMYAAVEHLIGHGHRQIAFLGRLGNSEISQRFDGYRDALAAHGIEYDQHLVVDVANELEEAGEDGMRVLLERNIPCTAIAAATDRNALGVYSHVRRLGLSIPDDYAVIGFDDIEFAQTCEPPLTTVRQRFDLLGTIAVAEMLKQFEGAAPSAMALHAPVALVVRRSCGCDGSPAADISRLLPQTDSVVEWEQYLGDRMIELLLYPFVIDEVLLTTISWPERTTLIEAIDAAVRNVEQPTLEAIEYAWQHALTLSTDLDQLNAVCDLLEQAGLERLGAADSRDSRRRIRATAARLRKELTRVLVMHGAAQNASLDYLVTANNSISHILLSDDIATDARMNWLRYGAIGWGCLGVWTDETRQQLELVSVYTFTQQAKQSVGNRYAARLFPPLDLLAADLDYDSTTMILPVHTNQRNWGVMVLGGFDTIDLGWNSHPMALWGGLLASSLERSALLNELAGQRETAQQAYERERALTDTLREVGSPVIPLFDGILLVPLIGAIDSLRATQLIKNTLEAVSQQSATNVLIDVTGVPVVDTHVAGAIIQLSQMISLLGARTMLVGIRPEIAQNIVGLGIDLRQLATSSSLAFALQQLLARRR